MNDFDLAWLAGYLEGEGCFTFAKRESPTVKVAATDEDVVRRAAILMKVKKVWCWPPSKNKQHYKPVYEASVRGPDALSLMKILLPHMGKRRADKIREVLNDSAARLGRPYGERHVNSKLSDAEVVRIKLLGVVGISSSELAKRYGVSQSLAWNILNGKRLAGRPIANTLVGT